MRDSIRFRTHLACFLVILVARHWQALLHPDFWAEDGPVWYAEAYRYGIASLTLPHSGYLQTDARLIACAAQALPLAWGPAFFYGCALAIQCLPPALLASRFAWSTWPAHGHRLLLAYAFVLLPNSAEVLTNVTNAQWHLACLALLVVVLPVESRSGRVITLIVLMASGLSGPFCLFLLPVAIWTMLERRARHPAAALAVVAICAGVQVFCLSGTMESTRSHAPLGASAGLLLRILTNQIFLAAVLGSRIVSHLPAVAPSFSMTARAVAVSVCFCLVGIAWQRGVSGFRQAVLWATLLTAAALAHPQVSDSLPQWSVLSRAGLGGRYFFAPMLVWLAVCHEAARYGPAAARIIARCLLALLPLGIAVDFPYPEMPDTEFYAQAAAFAAAPPGTVMVFRVLPLRFAPMILTKRAP